MHGRGRVDVEEGALRDILLEQIPHTVRSFLSG